MGAGARDCRGRAEGLLQLRDLFPQAPVRERTVGERADRSGLGSRGKRNGKKHGRSGVRFEVLWGSLGRLRGCFFLAQGGLLSDNREKLDFDGPLN